MELRKSSASVFTALPDGTGVLLNLETLVYFSLNRTGAIIWQDIDQAKTSELEHLVRSTCERFDVDQSSAGEGIEGFINQLARFGLVQVVDSKGWPDST
jgi:shikimate kinase